MPFIAALILKCDLEVVFKATILCKLLQLRHICRAIIVYKLGQQPFLLPLIRTEVNALGCLAKTGNSYIYKRRLDFVVTFGFRAQNAFAKGIL